MKTFVSIAVLFFLYGIIYAQPSQTVRPRVIISTDGEIDDKSSFVRFLMYTNDFDVEGIIATNSKWQKRGHGTGWIFDVIDLYGKVRPNLLLHSKNYPSVEYLKSKVVRGNEDPEFLTRIPPYKDTQGSELILKTLLENDERDVHVACWGGANTIAQALWKLKNNYPHNTYLRAVRKIKIYSVDFQDYAGYWIISNFHDAMIIKSACWYTTFGYRPQNNNPFPELMSEQWLTENVKTNHGPLGAFYPQKYVSEGDSPSFFNLIDNGLEAYKDYTLGGWGGRFEKVANNFYMDAEENGDIKKPFTRWIDAIQNDFAARMDWCVQPFDNANHPPLITQIEGYKKIVSPGDKITLKAQAADPDGNKLNYKWWHYYQADSTGRQIIFENPHSPSVEFNIPVNAKGKIQIILEVTDNGKPRLKRYKRFLFEIQNPAVSRVNK